MKFEPDFPRFKDFVFTFYYSRLKEGYLDYNGNR